VVLSTLRREPPDVVNFKILRPSPEVAASGLEIEKEGKREDK
jgi:hypothetical protein